MDIPTSEVNYLKERLNKQHEQQCLLEQIVSNISSLVEGSGDPMCIFDKDGFFMHVNASCRKLLGITEQHTSQKNIFDYYTTWDRDRVFKEVVQRRATKWSGQVTFLKHGNHEVRTYQVIEILHSSKTNIEGTFFKSYIAAQQETNAQEKLQVYYEMIRHMPVGVGIWRLEKSASTMLGSSLRLVCANSLASQYVGVTLHVGKDIHETLPNGGEVHQFLEEVIRTQRVSTLDKFRTAGGREVAVTAFPLSHEFVAVALESPKKDSWAAAMDSACLGVAVCDSLRILHCNEPFGLMLGQKDIAGKDAFSLLEQSVRSTGRSQVFDLRRAVHENRIYHVELELQQSKWMICVHPLSEGFNNYVMLTYRVKSPLHPSTFPILPHLREALPHAPPSVPSSQPTTSSSHVSTPPASTAVKAQNAETAPGLDFVMRELVENFPCGIAIAKAERHQDSTRFRIVSINRAARVFSTHLVIGKSFDERSPAPFDTTFVRLLASSAQTHERRATSHLNLYGSYLPLAARTIPLHDNCIGIVFEEAPTSQNSKRRHSEIDNGHQVLPGHRYPGLPQQTQTQTPPQNPPPQLSPSISSPPQVSSLLQSSVSSPQVSPSLKSPPSNKIPRQMPAIDIDGLPFSATLPKPFLPPIHSTGISDIWSSNDRESVETAIVQQCVIGIACFDVNGKISLVNRTFSQMLGCADYELVDQSISSFVSAADADNIKKAMHQIVCGESNSVELPICLISKRAQPVWAVATVHINQKAVGRAQVIVQVQQATRFHKYPEVLFSDPKTLRTVIKDMATGSAVLEFSSSLSIACANSTFCDALDMREEDLSGRLLTDFFSIDDREKTSKAAQDIVTTRIPSQKLSVRLLTKTGTTRAIISLSPMVSSKSQPLFIILQLQLAEKSS